MHPPAIWQFYLASSVMGYLLGSVPTGYLVGRRHGVDIREHGSGNIGATNVVRVLGKRLGYFVFLCDLLKGLLAVRLAMLLVAWVAPHALHQGIPGDVIAVSPHGVKAVWPPLAGWMTNAGILGALCCILGHNFPVWLRFRGGKGVATTVGVLLGLMPAAFLVATVVWIISFYASRYVSLASLAAAAALPPAVWLITRYTDPASRGFGPMFWFSIAAAALVFLRHRTNIVRLLNGFESRSVPKAKPR